MIIRVTAQNHSTSYDSSTNYIDVCQAGSAIQMIIEEREDKMHNTQETRERTIPTR